MFGRWPHELDRLPHNERVFLDRFYDRYLEVMYGKPEDSNDPVIYDEVDDVPADAEVVVGALIR